METEWNYTELAKAYVKRPDYADAAIDAMLNIVGNRNANNVCDIGSGVAHLTLMLAKRGLSVTAVEPNDAMRTIGMERTKGMKNVRWHEGTGEDNGQPDQAFDAVTFGSSFNVCDRTRALKETARILKPLGWVACMWNHRYLEDPIQLQIETIIKSYVPEYDYGVRREDQTTIIDKSGLFVSVIGLTARIVHEQTVDECVEAWCSHATLARQSGSSLTAVIQDIKDYVEGLNAKVIQVPYSTKIWMARLIS